MGLPMRQQSKTPDSSSLGQHRGIQVEWTARERERWSITEIYKQYVRQGPWGRGRKSSCPSSARTGAEGGGCNGGGLEHADWGIERHVGICHRVRQ